MQVCCKEGGHHGRQAFRLDVDQEYHHGDVFSRWVDLVYDIIANYSRELRIGVDIRRKENIEKVTEFAKRMKKI